MNYGLREKYEHLKKFGDRLSDMKIIIDWDRISPMLNDLYRNVNGHYIIRKYFSHGLGHLKNIEGKQIWKDILSNSFSGYSYQIAISQITITKPSVLNRFENMNKNKPMNKQIKPFNFMLIGSEVNNVIPCLPYSKDLSGIEYKPFTDRRTGLTSDCLQNYLQKSIDTP